MREVNVIYHVVEGVDAYLFTQGRMGYKECICECYDTDNSTGRVKVSIGDVVKYIPIRRYKPKFKTTAQTTMNVCASNFPAAALAQILDRILPDKILVPAKQTNVRIGLRSRNSTVSEIVKSSGFILKR